MATVAFSIGKAPRSEMANTASKIVPGPGTHEPTDVQTSNADPKWGFGSGTRPTLNRPTGTKELGPGAYTHTSRAVEGSKYSMGIINHT